MRLLSNLHVKGKPAVLPDRAIRSQSHYFIYRPCITHLRGRCNACQVRAYSLHDPWTPHPQSDSDANAPVKQKVYWGLCFLLHISFSVGQPYCYHWSNSITGTSCSYLLPHNYMLLQTALHYHKIVNIAIKVLSPDITKQAGSAFAVCLSGPVFKSWSKVGSW